MWNVVNMCDLAVITVPADIVFELGHAALVVITGVTVPYF